MQTQGVRRRMIPICHLDQIARRNQALLQYLNCTSARVYYFIREGRALIILMELKGQKESSRPCRGFSSERQPCAVHGLPPAPLS